VEPMLANLARLGDNSRRLSRKFLTQQCRDTSDVARQEKKVSRGDNPRREPLVRRSITHPVTYMEAA